MRRHNRLIITLLVAVLTAVALLLYRFQPASAETRESYSQGVQHFHDGEYAAAAKIFRQTLRRDPYHRNARFFLARSYLELKRESEAIEEMERILDFDPGDRRTALDLGHLYLLRAREEEGYFAQALHLAHQILARSPEDVDALILAGNASAGLQHYKTGFESLQRMLRLEPRSASVLQQIVGRKAYRRRSTEAEHFFQTALQLEPGHKSGLLSLANYSELVGDLSAAESFLRQAYRNFPTAADVYLPLARLLLIRAGIDPASQFLREVQSQVPSNPEPSLFEVDLRLAGAENHKAENLMAELRTRFPADGRVGKRIALMHLLSRPQLAWLEIQAVRKRGLDWEAALIGGQLEFHAQRLEQARRTFGALSSSLGHLPHAQYYLGRIAVSEDRVEDGIDHLTQALRTDPHYLPARLTLAEVHLRQRRPQDARHHLDRVLKTNPDHFDARLMRAILLRLESGDRPRQEFTALLRQYPGAQIYHRAALVYRSLGEVEQAGDHFRQALLEQPDSEEILGDFVRFCLERGRAPEAIQRLEAMEGRSNLPFEARRLEFLGRTYLTLGEVGQARKALLGSLQIYPLQTASILLGGLLSREGETGRALEVLETVIQRHPDCALAYALRGRIFDHLRKQEEAIRDYKQALSLDPTLRVAAASLAYLLAERNQDLSLARYWAETARRLDPSDPETAGTLGWVYFKLGQPVMALDQLQFASVHRPDDPLIHFHLAVVLGSLHLQEEAQEALQKALLGNRRGQDREVVSYGLIAESRRLPSSIAGSAL